MNKSGVIKNGKNMSVEGSICEVAQYPYNISSLINKTK